MLASWDDAWPVARLLIAIKQPVAQRALFRWKQTDAPILPRLNTPRGYRYWQKGGGFDRLVRTPSEMWREIEYCHQNPVKRGLVASPTDWPWSSARWYAGDRTGPIDIDEPR